MEIRRSGSQPSGEGPADYFTGAVRVDPLFEAPDPARVRCASVTFEPGARTAWHTHPLGQTLIVIAGAGWAQRWGGPVVEIRPGDVVWFPPGEKHWHGATPTAAMTHIDRCGSHQSLQSAGPRCARRFDRRGWDIRRDFCYRNPGRSACEHCQAAKGFVKGPATPAFAASQEMPSLK
jgi:quercetin dioxygenase-like cupin family protein